MNAVKTLLKHKANGRYSRLLSLEKHISGWSISQIRILQVGKHSINTKLWSHSILLSKVLFEGFFPAESKDHLPMMTSYKNILALFCMQIKGTIRQKGNLLIYCKKGFFLPCLVLFPTAGKMVCKHSKQHHSHQEGKWSPKKVFALCCLPNTGPRSFWLLL